MNEWKIDPKDIIVEYARARSNLRNHLHELWIIHVLFTDEEYESLRNTLIHL